ncbi:MAG: hypothetical protein R3Y07_09940 [Eubacteriales bacterium]
MSKNNNIAMNLPKKEQMLKTIKGVALYAVPLLLVWVSIWGFGGYQASEYALHHANVTRNDVSFIRFNLDLDDFIPQYEVSWYQGTREAEVTVHAFTGQLLDLDWD